MKNSEAYPLMLRKKIKRLLAAVLSRTVYTLKSAQFNVRQRPYYFLPAGDTVAILDLTGILSVSRLGV